MKKNLFFILPFLVVLVLAIATIVGRIFGISVAIDIFYHHWWFLGLCILVVVVSLFAFARNKNTSGAAIIIHSAILFVLTGAVLTFFAGEKGTIHLRAGIPARLFLDDNSEACHALPFTICLSRFDVKYYSGTECPKDYVSEVIIQGQNVQVSKTASMNHVVAYGGYRFLQGSYDDDKQGVVMLVNHDPWGMWLVNAGYLLFVSGMIWWFFSRTGMFRQQLSNVIANRRSLILISGAFFFAVVVVPMYVIIRMSHSEKYLQPVLQSPWLIPHVWCIISGYLLFIFMAFSSLLAGFLYLKRMLPEVENLQRISILMLYPALALLGVGICLGSVWANDSWGAYWSWDPKEVWALITFIVYAIPVHNEKLKWLQHPTYFHSYILLALLSVLMTYFGVNGFLGGMHSYGN